MTTEPTTDVPAKRARVRATVAPVAEASEAPESAQPDSPTADEFVAASRLFAASGSTGPVEVAAEVPENDEPITPIDLPAHVARRRPRVNIKRITATSLSVGVVGCVMALTVAMAFPAAPAGNDTARVVASGIADDDAIQAFVASSEVQNTDVERSADFQSVTAAEIAAETGIRYSRDVFTNNPTSAIQWPYAVGTGMSYGFGMRDGRMHEGVDFTPGDGAPIQAIADGTVRIATENGGGYGVEVYIDHVIDGETVTSHYAHMQVGSLKVKAGDTVKVGDPVGLTGNTGHSFGAHLHFEIIINGATIDPLPWLYAHAGGKPQ